MSDIIWTNTTITLGQLKPWQRNPRQSSKKQAQRLLASWDKFGQVQTIAIDPDGNVLDGHQRLSALLTVHGKAYQVDARQSNRTLTEKEREELVATLHAGAVGSWDWNALSSWDAPDLIEWGFSFDTLNDWQTGVTNLANMLGSEEEPEDEQYSRKIEAPIYTPKGDKPAVSTLYDTTRTKALLDEIEQADLPEDEKEFLRIAARRHTVLNFKRIAEYYAHSDEKTQTLMENSALVIIDFERAIELGYVKLSEEIAAQYLKDYPDAG